MCECYHFGQPVWESWDRRHGTAACPAMVVLANIPVNCCSPLIDHSVWHWQCRRRTAGSLVCTAESRDKDRPAYMPPPPYSTSFCDAVGSASDKRFLRSCASKKTPVPAKSDFVENSLAHLSDHRASLSEGSCSRYIGAQRQLLGRRECLSADQQCADQ